MSETNKSYRIKANVGQDTNIMVNLDQSYNVFEILSLKLTDEDTYKLHSANYGVIVGRVLANGGFGVPNAKISVFIEGVFDESTTLETATIYPYSTTSDANADGVRYNLLPDNQADDCHQVVGTFPNKTYMLDNDSIIDVFDKYYVYTTRTNNAGDYMICGVPTGQHTIHMDLDLSDCGILSQRPRDFVYKGYTIEQFENPNQFKTGSNLDSLSQIFSQDTVVNVIPFWGNEELGETIGISRADINVNFKFEPTCVFIGSLVADNASNGISKKCIPTNQMGSMDELTTGEGTIEMIRKTPNGDVEEFQIKGTQLINGNGIWCYQIPMNLDYMMTDEYGNMVPTDDPSKGIPTRARVRFRISMDDKETNTDNYFRAKVLVPHNPQNYFQGTTEKHEDYDYEFGTYTREDSFRDLFWNDVYTVKSYIPRFQKSRKSNTDRFSGIKHCNIFGNNNPIPYNNIRIKMPFMFILLCAMIKTYIRIVYFVNGIIDYFAELQASLSKIILFSRDERRKFQKNCEKTKFTLIADGICPDLDNWYFAPTFSNINHETDPEGIWGPSVYYNTLQQTFNYLCDNADEDEKTIDKTSVDYNNKNEETDSVCLTKNTDYLISCIEMNLAQEYKVINFDFYNDWINGVIYMPRWMKFVRKKRTFLFGLIKIRPKVKACMDDSSVFGKTRFYVQQCALTYGKTDGKYTKITNHNGCMTSNSSKQQKCHKLKGLRRYSIFGSGSRKGDKGNGGVVHEKQTMKNQYVYYFKPCEWRTSTGKKTLLFANDIVLLGSLNECNLHGVPQAFKYLTSSSYVMPTNLALTNMDDDGYLYADDEGTICSSKKNLGGRGTTEVEPSFENEQKFWDGKPKEENVVYGPDTQNNPDTLNYDDTIPLTEAAGIAWNYTGPGQGEKSNNVTKSLYYPGGHFLGLSCTNSETNIKSCVNLQRICEVGTTESQRREEVSVVNYNQSNNNTTVRYKYFVPTGLIAQDEITGSDFRSMFATMNHKRLLCTNRYDEKTGYPIYDFAYLKPIGFDGVLKDKVLKSSDYNTKVEVNDEKRFMQSQKVSLSDDYDSREYDNTYTRTVEDASEDYYMFRLGLSGLSDAEQKSKFLYSQGSAVALPQYENSYYFYFGLKDGATALDEFNKQFFATCESKSVFMNTPMISTGAEFNPCTLSLDLTVEVSNMEIPVTISLKNTSTEQTQLKTVSTSPVRYTFENIPRGSYEITATDNNSQIITKTIEVGGDSISMETNTKDFEFKTKNISEVKYIVASGKSLDCGYISVGEYVTLDNSDPLHINTNGTLLVLVDSNNDYVISNNSTGALSTEISQQICDILGIEEIGKNLAKVSGLTGNYKSFDDYTYYVWRADETYDLFVIRKCIDDNKNYVAYYDTFIINGCDNYDLYLGSKFLPYSTELKNLSWGWWDNAYSSSKRDWAMRHALFRQTDDDNEYFRNNLISLNNNGKEIDTALFGQPDYFENDRYYYFGSTTYYENDNDYFDGEVADDSIIPTWPEAYSKNRYGKEGQDAKLHYGEMATFNGIMASDKIGNFNVTLSKIGDRVKISLQSGSISENIVRNKYGCVVRLEDDTLVYPVRDGNDYYYYGDLPDNTEQTVSFYPVFYYPIMYRPFYAKEYVLDWVNGRIDVVKDGNQYIPSAFVDCESWRTHLKIYNGITYNGKFYNSSDNPCLINGIESAITVGGNDLTIGSVLDDGYSNVRSINVNRITDINSSGYTADYYGFKITEGCPNFNSSETKLINSPYELELTTIEGEASNDFPTYINYGFGMYENDIIFNSDLNSSSAVFYIQTGNTPCPLTQSGVVYATKRPGSWLSNNYILCRYNENANNLSSKNIIGDTIAAEVDILSFVHIPMFLSDEDVEQSDVLTRVNNFINPDSQSIERLRTAGVDVVYFYKTNNNEDIETFIQKVKNEQGFRRLEGLGKDITFTEVRDKLPSNYYIVALKQEVSGVKGEVNVARVYPHDSIQKINSYTPPSEPSIDVIPYADTGLFDVVTENSGSTFVAEGGNLEIKVKCTTNWNFTFESEEGDTSWIKVNGSSSYNGNKNETLTIRATENTSYEDKIVSGIAKTFVTHPDEEGVQVPYMSYVVFKICRKMKVSYILPTTTQIIGSEGGEFGVDVFNNLEGNWTFTLEGGDWINIKNSSTNTITGHGNSTIYLQANSNPSSSERTATVRISPYEDENHVGREAFIFTQQASPSELEVVPASVNFGYNDTTEQTVTVICNGTWEADTEDRWIDFRKVDDKILIKVSVNSGEARVGTLRVYTPADDPDNGKVKHVTINQQGAYHISSELEFHDGTIYDGSSATIKCNEDFATLRITATTPWELSTQEDWITFSEDYGNTDDTVNVYFDYNRGSQRTGKIKVKSTLGNCTPVPTEYNLIQRESSFRIKIVNNTNALVYQIMLINNSDIIELLDGESEFIMPGDNFETSIEVPDTTTQLTFNGWRLFLTNEIQFGTTITFCGLNGQREGDSYNYYANGYYVVQKNNTLEINLV